MTHYVAMMRGFGPGDPNMRHDRLRPLFEGLGFTDVQPVISSGNVVFQSDATDTARLESIIETALEQHLGFFRAAVVRSQADIQRLVDSNPFAGIEPSASSNWNVTFLKSQPKIHLNFPYRPEGKQFELLSLNDRAICSVLDRQFTTTPDLMTWLERQFGKGITTRTWKTVGRLLQKLAADGEN
jgi:uncharacterized protein (DUF1697 family)